MTDTGKPHPARMCDWYLGGKDNYPVDEEMGRQMLALDPRVPVMARVNRAFFTPEESAAASWNSGRPGSRRHCAPAPGPAASSTASNSSNRACRSSTTGTRSWASRYRDGTTGVIPGYGAVARKP